MVLMLKYWSRNLNFQILTFVLIFSTVINVTPADANGCYTVTAGELTNGSSCTGALTIPNTVTSIGNNAFALSTLSSITIPDSVLTIGSQAFKENYSLTSVTFGNGVTSIGYGAFYETNLTSVSIPNSVLTIGQQAFQGNVALTSVTIGNSVTTIGVYAFSTEALTSVTFLGNAPATVNDFAFYKFGPNATANVLYNATGFPANGSTYKRLTVSYGNAPSPANDSDSSPIPVVVPVEVEKSDAEFDLKDRKSISKRDMKITLSKNQSFKRNPKDLYKYSIFGTSKKTCAIKGNFVVALKETGVCEMWLTRTTPTGAKNKYWVKINYSN